MPLLTLSKVSLAYGHHPLLEKVDFQIDPGERVCLVGRNGAGKSTLLKIISAAALPDDGEIWRKDTLTISYLEQEVPQNADLTVFEIVANGLGETGKLLYEYHKTANEVSNQSSVNLERLADLQHQIEMNDGWTLNQKVESTLSRLSLPSDTLLKNCSGGIRRRVMLAQALVSEPDLLLLDEPTNHMDIAAIQWLEEFLLTFSGAIIFITHDRTFLRRLATRIVELDRGKLTSFNGDFDFYLQKKDEFLQAETRANAKFDKKLAEHEVWIRQGIKARRTRNEGRVTKLIEMRNERAQRINKQGQVKLNVDSSEMSGKRVIDLQNVSFAYGEHKIVDNFSTRIMRKDRIGIIGANGSGKSTLLKIILGELAPQSGEVVLGTKVQLAYFDQQRELLDLKKSVRDNIAEGKDFVEVQGKSRHVISYLRDFLFPPDRIDSPVEVLSGGERNRLLLARIFTRPSNLIVLDEPTNDLDVDTLELLEELIAEYEGTLLLVSHDRTFLDNIVTSTIVFEDNAEINEYVGGYEDWIRQRKQSLHAQKNPVARSQDAISGASKAKLNTAQKLNHKEKRELDNLPAQIETLEKKQQEIEMQMLQADFYQQDKHSIAQTVARLEKLRDELAAAYQRWEQLEAKK